MRPDIRHLIRVAKRVTQARGYIELGMTHQALTCLEGLEPLGPFQAEAAVLRGTAFGIEHRYEDAAEAMKVAASVSCTPHDQATLLALSACLHKAGRPKRR